ncbi:hypothetical protein [Aequorivita ciconiae]|uniref:hypothetical protein n=1 Tax=Aequorivita ciconiae TaxID=2494375 RepID=UPI0013E2C873|nr:hypothetical protein [Aequorivita sp. H23M31]
MKKENSNRTFDLSLKLNLVKQMERGEIDSIFEIGYASALKVIKKIKSERWKY